MQHHAEKFPRLDPLKLDTDYEILSKELSVFTIDPEIS